MDGLEPSPTQEVVVPAQAETLIYRPLGSGVQRRDGELMLQFLLPDKIVIIAIPEGEGEQALLTQLTGGIQIARDLPFMPPGGDGKGLLR